MVRAILALLFCCQVATTGVGVLAKDGLSAVQPAVVAAPAAGTSTAIASDADSATVPAAAPSAVFERRISLRADSWCPYNCDPKSDRQGYMVDIVRAVFEPLGYTVDYNILPWSRALNETRSGQHDAVLGAGRDDAKDFVFGLPLGLSGSVLAQRRGYGFHYQGPASLQGHRLGAAQDYAYDPELDAYIQAAAGQMNAVQLLTGENVASLNLRKLAGGRIDLVLEDSYVLAYALGLTRLSEMIDVQPVGVRSPLYIAFSPNRAGSRHLAGLLDNGVRQLRSDGRLARILTRYGVADWQHPNASDTANGTLSGTAQSVAN